MRLFIASPVILDNYASIKEDFKDIIEGKWTGPNGVVNFNDISAAVKGFQELEDAPRLPRLDLDGEVPNKLINFNDISRVVQAFQGNRYPFVGQ